MKKNYFRARLSKEISSQVTQYLSCLEEDKRLVEIDIDVVEAHSIMLNKCGYVEKETLKKILRSLEQARKDYKNNKFKFPQQFHDIHPIIETYVINSCGIEFGGMVNLAKSRNDQIVADMRIYLRGEIIDLQACILNFIETLFKIALKNKKIPMPTYTHLQPAQISTFSYYVISYIYPLLRIFEDLSHVYRCTNLNPLGSSAIAGTSIRIDRNLTTELLGFDGLIKNTIDAVSNRDFILNFSSVCGALMVNLSRLAEDIVIFSSQEFNLFNYPDEFADISTAMPQKKNPCPVELLRARSTTVLSIVSQLYNIVNKLPTGYYRDLQEMKPALWKLIDTVKSSIKIMNLIFQKMKINKERAEAIIKQGDVIAIELSEFLTTRKKLSFRESNFLIGNLIKQGLKLTQLTPQFIITKSKELLNKDIKMTDKELKKITSLKEIMKNRPDLKKDFELIRIEIRKKNKELQEKKVKIRKAKNKLKKLVNSFL